MNLKRNYLLPTKRMAYLLLAGFLAGVIWFVGVRMILLKSEHVHYHANFAVYIDGKREPFDSYVYYEEIQSCSSDASDPRTRVHMHDSISHVVHVHDKGATWGHFFANLGYDITDKALQTRSDVYLDGSNGKKISFILNDQPVTNLANRVIQDTDRLLVNYGSESDADLRLRYATVEHDAAEVNKKTDPATCSGQAPDGAWDRLKRAVWQ